MITLITSIIGLLTALTMFILIRRDHLHVRYGIAWMAVALVFALLGFFPSVFDRVAAFLGVAYPPVLALILGVVILVLKILLLDIERSRDTIRFQRLVQRVALLETEIQEVREKNSKSDDESDPGDDPHL